MSNLKKKNTNIYILTLRVRFYFDFRLKKIFVSRERYICSWREPKQKLCYFALQGVHLQIVSINFMPVLVRI